METPAQYLEEDGQGVFVWVRIFDPQAFKHAIDHELHVPCFSLAHHGAPTECCHHGTPRLSDPGNRNVVPMESERYGLPLIIFSESQIMRGHARVIFVAAPERA